MTIHRPETGWKIERTTTHPGEMLREEFLVPLNLSAEALAARLAVSVAEVQAVIDEREPVLPEMALRLSRCFHTSAQFWLNLQSLHDLTKAQQKSGLRIDREVEPMAMTAAA